MAWKGGAATVGSARNGDGQKNRADSRDASAAGQLSTIANKVKILIGLFQVLSQFTANFPQVNWPFEFKDFTADMKVFNL